MGSAKFTTLTGICAGMLCLICSPVPAGDSPVPAIDADAVTVSGVSSGGSMAHQVHVAYPEVFRGVGIVAGIPWNCAEGRLDLALGRCTGKEEGPLPVDRYLGAIAAASEAGTVGDPGLLKDDRVWLFHGAKDTLVPAKVADALAGVYAGLVSPDSVRRVDDVPAAHGFPTLDAGAACDVSETPWLGACDYDAAGELLKHLYDGLAEPGEADRQPDGAGNLHEIDLPGAGSAGMASRMYLFVPPSCPETGCRLHVAFHGCAQAASQIGTTFVDQAGYLPWARANGIVVAFPQAVVQPLNPLACWDWWGYTGPDYLERGGKQAKVVTDWVTGLARH